MRLWDYMFNEKILFGVHRRVHGPQNRLKFGLSRKSMCLSIDLSKSEQEVFNI